MTMDQRRDMTGLHEESARAGRGSRCIIASELSIAAIYFRGPLGLYQTDPFSR